MALGSNPPYKGLDRAFCVRMKSTLTKRGCHFKSSGYRVSKHIQIFQNPSSISKFVINTWLKTNKKNSKLILYVHNLVLFHLIFQYFHTVTTETMEFVFKYV